MMNRFRIWRRKRRNRGKPYKLPLKDLIAKCMSRMIVKPVCPQCNNLMVFRHSTIVIDVFPVRDDTTFKCTICFHTIHFGNPMTRKDALEEIDLRGSRYLSRPTKRSDEEDMEIIKERLRKLGYIE